MFIIDKFTMSNNYSYEWMSSYRIAGYFRGVYISANFAKAQPILENKNLERHLMWEEAWFSISIREITFREQELN